MNWELLHPDLLSLIFSYLPLSNLIRSALVCKQWRQSAAESHNQRPQLPWLFKGLIMPKKLEQSRLEDSQFFNAFSLSDGYYNLNLREWCDCWDIRSSYEDWLVLLTCNGGTDSSSFNYVLYNPFTTVQIDLPPHNHTRLTDLVLSSSPQSAGCVAALITIVKLSDGSTEFCAQFCNVNRGLIASWSSPIPCGKPAWKTAPIFYQESLYIIYVNKALYVANTNNGDFTMVIQSSSELHLSQWLKGRDKWEREKYYSRETLMVCGGELLMLSRIYNTYDDKYVSVMVYKANFEIATWEICKSLNGQALFIPHLSMAPASSYGIEGDCVYFNQFSKSEFDSFRVSDERWIQNCFGEKYSTSENRGFFDGGGFFILTPKPRFCLEQ